MASSLAPVGPVDGGRVRVRKAGIGERHGGKREGLPDAGVDIGNGSDVETNEGPTSLTVIAAVSGGLVTVSTLATSETV